MSRRGLHGTTAEIVETKHGPQVKIKLTDGDTVWASRDQTGRIRYDHPERVPRVMKYDVVKRLFKEIDARRFGISLAGAQPNQGR